MPDIYQDMRQLIFPSLQDNLNIYNGHKDLIQDFLDNPKHETARKLFTFIAHIHRKNYVFDLMSDLKIYEEGFKKILPDHREHYLHSANVYCLGLALYNCCRPLREALITPRHNPENNHEQRISFLFRWSLASCLHDVCYPFELSVKGFNDYSKFLHGGIERNDLIINSSILSYFDDTPVIERGKLEQDIPAFLKKNSAIGLISSYVYYISNGYKDIKYSQVKNFIRSEIIKNLKLGIFDHGIFSSLIVIKRIHELYWKKEDWNVFDFYFEVIDSATAIFLHNFYKFSNLKSLLESTKFNHHFPSPLGYLLCLCDTLCEWNRSNIDDKNQYRLNCMYQEEISFGVPRGVRADLIRKIDFLNETIQISIN